MKVAIQGIRGAFHEAAAQKHFGQSITIVECTTFRSLCEDLKNGLADYGIMAIENTIAGSILGNYALIHEYGFQIIGEVYLNIQMNLLILPHATPADIKVVESHPMALMQCQDFLIENFPGITCRESNDTAESAKLLTMDMDVSRAVIASRSCEHLYGLKVQATNIETDKQNFTRFLILSNIKDVNKNANKASLRLRLGNEVGALANVLTIFKKVNINLSKIQSVPVIGTPYEYFFYIDVAWNSYDEYLGAIDTLKDEVVTLSILGEYQKSTFELNN